MNFKNTISLLFLLFFLVTLNAQDTEVQNLSISRQGQELQIKIASIDVPFFDQIITNVSYKCKSPAQVYPLHQCTHGLLTAYVADKKFSYGVNGWIDFSQKKWNITLSNRANNLFVKFNSDHQESLDIVIDNVAFSQIRELLPFEIDLSGELSTKVNAKITIDFSQALLISSSYHLSSVNYEGEQGDYVMADGDITGNISMNQVNDGFAIKNTSSISKGEILAQDIYVKFDDYPTKFKSEFKINNLLQLIDIKLETVYKNEMNIQINSPDDTFNELVIDFDIKNLESFHQGFLASYFEILGVDDLEIIGQAQGQIKLLNQKITALDTNVSELFMAIESKKINVNDLNAQLHWQEDGEVLVSKLYWDELLLAGMPIKKSNLEVFTQAQRLWLPDDTSIPIFDGSLVIKQLKLDKIFDPEISIDFSGEVQPISIALITEKMEWPIMQGSLSGKIPGMKKIGHSISFDGVLDIDIFDGHMQVENLSIERLFGIAPVVAGDIIFENLNLQQITSTYDFGEITGRVKGYINGLRITNWKADRLIAHVESVKTKGIKQTISQRAIDNISSIGGIQGALSRSFLRFFDYFNYKKLGIGCKLRNSICEMSGINDGSDSYTLIQGRGIPSINIIGFRKFIDWEVFIDRLLNAGY